MIRQIWKFLAAGLTAAAVEFGSFLLLYYVTSIPIWAANGLSFCLGLLTSFSLNRQWTYFSYGYNKKMYYQFVLYGILAGVNLLLTLGIVHAFVVFGAVPGMAKFLAMGMTSVWNFVLYRQVIFKAA